MGWQWARFRVVYALKLKCGWFKRRLPIGEWSDFPASPLRIPVFSGPGSARAVAVANRLLQGEFTFFFRHRKQVGFPPDWILNPFAPETSPPDRRQKLVDGHWSEVSDADGEDIKGVWELSRFSFVYTLARAYAYTRSETYAEAYWKLIEDWRCHTSPNRGVHWKCGQETAFRLIAWSFGAGALSEAKASTSERRAALSQMIAASATRIEGNLSYALSQANNHGISEAAGLWTAGLVLAEHPRASRWRTLGKTHLQQQARTLVYDDGTFSQYSMNYHRVMLQAYLWAIQLGRLLGETLGDALVARVGSAGHYLGAMVTAPERGLTPNLGANDGALILPLTDCDYRDVRPTVQAASMIADGRKALPPGAWDEALDWLCLVPDGDPPASPREAHRKPVTTFDRGGYTILRGQRTTGVVRCTPTYRHRPSHADQLHLDLWCNGINICPDAGSYSYNCPEPWLSYFRSTAAHNTVEFDERDQMPRLGRFLFSEWLPVTAQVRSQNGKRLSWVGEYEDFKHCRHRREIDLDGRTDTWRITDTVSGYDKRAVLRWRLTPSAAWDLVGNGCRSPLATFSIKVDRPRATISLGKGWESLYYREKTDLPVIEVVLPAPSAVITTTVSFPTKHSPVP